MKTSFKTIAASIALTALMVGPAAAMVSQGNVTQDVLSAAGAGSNIFVNVDDDVATLTGYFESASHKKSAIQAAKANVGIDRVIDLTTVSN